MVDIPSEYVWIVVLGFVLAFILCLGIGANDVANAFGTSVGSKVLTLRQACILGTIFETAGAVLLGAKVSETVRKGIIDVEVYENTTDVFLLGNVAALGGSSIWLIIATALKVPVSTTHSIIGATIGYALVANGTKGIDWFGLLRIVISWFVSPVLSGLITVGIFMLCDYFIIRKSNPLERGLSWLPIFYAFTIAINIFSIFFEGPEFFKFDLIPLWGVFTITFGTGIIAAFVVYFIVVPLQRRTIIQECSEIYETEKTKIVHGTPDYNPVTFTTSTSTQALVPSNNSGITLKSYSNEGFQRESSSSSSFSHLQVPLLSTLTASMSNVPKTSEASSATIGTEFVLGEDELKPKPISNDLEVPTLPGQSNGAIDGQAHGQANGQALGQANVYSNIDAHDSNTGSVEVAKESTDDGEKKGEVKDSADDGEKNVEVKDSPETERLFSFLQILTAIFGSFAHGGNDVSNGIGPLISIWLVATTNDVNTEALTPLWILLYGGMGISIGLWVWGRRVIETIGEDLTTVTPSSGFCIEIGAALTVLVASNIGIPVSSTHCKVGSIVSVGRIRSKDNVDWSLFRNIAFSWVVTVPAAGAFSAAIMALLLLSV